MAGLLTSLVGSFSKRYQASVPAEAVEHSSAPSSMRTITLFVIVFVFISSIPFT
jgi:hypothetical protein